MPNRAIKATAVQHSTAIGGAGRHMTRPFARRFLGAAVVVAATAAIVGNLGVAQATTTGPTVYEQQRGSSSTPLAMYPTKTTITLSPILATGTYAVNGVVTIGIINPGTGATCGIKTSGGLSDNVTADTGQLGNGNNGGSFVDGNCVVTGTVKLNVANDRVALWAAVGNGTGAVLDNASINETPIGGVVISH
jgi:hypothetical protein